MSFGASSYNRAKKNAAEDAFFAWVKKVVYEVGLGHHAEVRGLEHTRAVRVTDGTMDVEFKLDSSDFIVLMILSQDRRNVELVPDLMPDEPSVKQATALIKKHFCSINEPPP